MSDDVIVIDGEQTYENGEKEEIVVTDSGTVYETSESAIIAKEEADRAEKWALYAEDKANLADERAIDAAESSDASAQAATAAIEAKEYAEKAITDENLIVVAEELKSDPSNIKIVAENIDSVKDAYENANKAKESETNAQIWAEGEDAKVSTLGGIHSSKGWAGLAEESATNSNISEINALASADNAKNSEVAAKVSEINADTSAINSEASATNSLGYSITAKDEAEKSATSAQNAKESEDNAKLSETNAKASENASKASEENAKTSEVNASTSASNAKTSETNAKTSETNASTSEKNAKTSETASATSEKNAKTSETNAKTSEENAKTSADTASAKADTATSQANTATQQANNAITYAGQAKASETNAKTYATQAQEVLERLGTVIKIKGRVNSVNDLPTSGNLDGDAYLVGGDGLDAYPEYYWYSDHWEFLGTSGTSLTWGAISGTLSNQADLQSALDNKQDTLTDDQLSAVNSGITADKLTEITDDVASNMADIATKANTSDVYTKSVIDEKLENASAKADGVTITKNDSGEVQAVAVYEQNGTVKYDWIGTTAEYEAQNIATEHPTWVCYITDDYQNPEYATKDEVEAEISAVKNEVEEEISAVKSDIESNPAITAPYLKTSYVNDTSGYRIWSDGYCEQWGNGLTIATSGTVNFVKTFNSQPLVYFAVISNRAASSYDRELNPNSVTTTYFTYTQTAYAGVSWGWKASGYLADGEY